jgi:hypothetical protein
VASAATTLTNLGFLTVLQEGGGYLGGYLITNVWGRPLAFRLSSAVQPNKVQQILYAGTLQAYLCADLIGKTLVDKAGLPAQLVLTDREAVLDLRLKSEAPVMWLVPPDDPRALGAEPSVPLGGGRGALLAHPRFAADIPLVRDLLADLDSAFDLAEPFARIREAIGEARKMGVTGRAA